MSREQDSSGTDPAAPQPLAQFTAITSSNSSFLARFQLPLEVPGGRLRVSLMIDSPASVSIQGVADLEERATTSENPAREFAAATAEWIELGCWSLRGAAPHLTLTGLCKPAKAQAELIFNLSWEIVTEQLSSPAM